ncbi:hypothetical protein C8R43DRAFT_1106902 [Mycena crocata]|nr:hypothetical protein C8R43DRAFT_1106902 [Mycena crocata]
MPVPLATPQSPEKSPITRSYIWYPRWRCSPPGRGHAILHPLDHFGNELVRLPRHVRNSSATRPTHRGGLPHRRAARVPRESAQDVAHKVLILPVAALIRLGRKYKFHNLWEGGVEDLTFENPSTLEEYNARLTPNRSYLTGILFNILTLARENDILSALLCAYFRLGLGISVFFDKLTVLVIALNDPAVPLFALDAIAYHARRCSDPSTKSKAPARKARWNTHPGLASQDELRALRTRVARHRATLSILMGSSNLRNNFTSAESSLPQRETRACRDSIQKSKFRRWFGRSLSRRDAEAPREDPGKQLKMRSGNSEQGPVDRLGGEGTQIAESPGGAPKSGSGSSNLDSEAFLSFRIISTATRNEVHARREAIQQLSTTLKPVLFVVVLHSTDSLTLFPLHSQPILEAGMTLKMSSVT